VHRTEGMLEPRMLRRGIGVMGEAELQDPSQPLEIRVLDHIEDQRIGDRNETVYRVVDDLLLVGGMQNGVFLLNIPKSGFPAQ